ncbi:MAG: two pore domain potassium channel family protein [Planctomycetes bacterium]|nr:two pore domain potassium channel family protein [Planctomycetota bacterium]MBI3845192.1 two pore domain potassium channel family protein [Planctomycetota bacterium]
MRRNWRFIFLLISLLLAFGIAPFVENHPIGVLALGVFLAAILVAGILATSDQRHVFIGALSLAALTVITLVLAVTTANIEFVFGSRAAMALFFAVTGARILAHVVKDERVTADKLYGAVCVYLLIGLTWAFVYSILELAEPGTFVVAPSRPGSATPSSGQVGEVFELTYYSFTTLTTVGFGDVTARTGPARALSAIEALAGQIYVAVLIARLVSLQVAYSSREHESIER